MGEIRSNVELQNTVAPGVFDRGGGEERSIRWATVDGVVDTGAAGCRYPNGRYALADGCQPHEGAPHGRRHHVRGPTPPPRTSARRHRGRRTPSTRPPSGRRPGPISDKARGLEPRHVKEGAGQGPRHKCLD